MSTAIIRFQQTPNMLFYCNKDSYPTGLGFDLMTNLNTNESSLLSWLLKYSNRFTAVYDIPKDVQYEYTVDYNTKSVQCKEFWYTADKSYHGGGFRYGATINLKKLQESVKLQKEYTYRLPEYWT